MKKFGKELTAKIKAAAPKAAYLRRDIKVSAKFTIKEFVAFCKEEGIKTALKYADMEGIATYKTHIGYKDEKKITFHTICVPSTDGGEIEVSASKRVRQEDEEGTTYKVKSLGIAFCEGISDTFTADLYREIEITDEEDDDE